MKILKERQIDQKKYSETSFRIHIKNKLDISDEFQGLRKHSKESED